jgi:isopentenyl diphosphate isomerase/L-lactate dehydrogenase-like FMN-dependent dehydrogenase
MDSLQGDPKEEKRYEKKSLFQVPGVVSMMLNTQVEGVFSNEQFTLYLTEDRQVYSCGFDLR